jgi:hypothetical protein
VVGMGRQNLRHAAGDTLAHFDVQEPEASRSVVGCRKEQEGRSSLVLVRAVSIGIRTEYAGDDELSP